MALGRVHPKLEADKLRCTQLKGRKGLEVLAAKEWQCERGKENNWGLAQAGRS
jgi:hypothetical protein